MEERVLRRFLQDIVGRAVPSVYNQVRFKRGHLLFLLYHNLHFSSRFFLFDYLALELLTTVAVLMHGKVTAVKLASVELLIEVVDLGVFAAASRLLVLLLVAVLPHARALVHRVVARAIVFVEDEDCSVFAVVESVTF